MLEYLKDIMKEIAEEENIKMEQLSKDWIVKFTKDDKTAWMVGSKFSLNSDAAWRIASDKYATYEVLKDAHIPVIEHRILFHPKTRKGWKSDFQNRKELYDYWKQHQNQLVVKPNEGFGGNMVYLCKTKRKLSQSVKKIFRKKDSLSICPFYEIDTEFRLVMLDGECKLLFGKKHAKGNFKCNLCQGASVVMVEDESLQKELITMAQKVVKTLKMRFASVDIMQDKKGELLVMEVNAGVMIHKYAELVSGGRDVAKNIYREAILKMLNS